MARYMSPPRDSARDNRDPTRDRPRQTGSRRDPTTAAATDLRQPRQRQRRLLHVSAVGRQAAAHSESMKAMRGDIARVAALGATMAPL